MRLSADAVLFAAVEVPDCISASSLVSAADILFLIDGTQAAAIRLPVLFGAAGEAVSFIDVSP